jgi:hypothetical protein
LALQKRSAEFTVIIGCLFQPKRAASEVAQRRPFRPVSRANARMPRLPKIEAILKPVIPIVETILKPVIPIVHTIFKPVLPIVVAIKRKLSAEEPGA